MSEKIIRWRPKTTKHKLKLKPSGFSQAFSGLVQDVSKFSAFLGLISVLGYWLSWNQLDGYYRAVGVDWYANTYSKSEILMSGVPLFILFVTTYYLCHINISEQTSGKKISIVSSIFLTIGSFGSLPLRKFEFFLQDWLAALISFGLLICIFTGTTLTIIRVLQRVVDENLTWKSAHFLMLICVLWVYLIPNFREMGSRRATVDMDPSKSKLAYVQKNRCESCVWRILDIRGDKALLVKISTEKENRKFMLTTLGEDWEIVPVR